MWGKTVIVGYTFHGGDLFHVGHLHQLKECYKHCDILWVGVLSDKALASYKRLPVIPYEQRAEIYRAIKYVDVVIMQDSRDPTENLERLEPDILFHADDWDEIPGKEWIESHGGKLITTPYFKGTSTTDIIRRILKREDLYLG